MSERSVCVRRASGSKRKAGRSGEARPEKYTSRFADVIFSLGESAGSPTFRLRISARSQSGGRVDSIMRDEYVRAALQVIDDPNILINVVSRRVKQLKRGNRALVESLEKLSAEDTALREVIERKISYELATPAEIAAYRG
jgi:DNA-directed RNA polymerase subunit omega